MAPVNLSFPNTLGPCDTSAPWPVAPKLSAARHQPDPTGDTWSQAGVQGPSSQGRPHPLVPGKGGVW